MSFIKIGKNIINTDYIIYIEDRDDCTIINIDSSASGGKDYFGTKVGLMNVERMIESAIGEGIVKIKQDGTIYVN